MKTSLKSKGSINKSVKSETYLLNIEKGSGDTIKEKEPLRERSLEDTIAAIVSTETGASFSPTMKSPVPQIEYSPGVIISPSELKIKHLVQEIIGSETVYYELLDLTLKHYVSPLLNFSTNTFGSGIPLLLLSTIIEDLLKLHKELYSVPFHSKSVNSIDEIVGLVCETISSIVSQFYIYVQYCDIFQDILNMLNDSHEEEMSFKSLLRSLNRYLEATQPITKSHDLSFISLIQKPITRFGKYRLFLEALLKLFASTTHQESYTVTLQALNLTMKSLNVINKETVRLQVNKTSKLISILDPSLINVPLSFFGKNYLVGSILIAWMELENLQYSQVSAVLFKSHLILCQQGHFRRAHTFIIPLSKCSLVSDEKESEGGLYSTYPYSFKLIIQVDRCHYELLIVCISQTEYSIWLQHLQTLVLFVNGPCNMKFEDEDEELSLLSSLPGQMSPSNLSLSVEDKQLRNSCYFQRPINVEVKNSIFPLNFSRSESTSFLSKGAFNYFKIRISKRERVRLERKIGDCWSDELPKVQNHKHQTSKNKGITWADDKNLKTKSSLLSTIVNEQLSGGLQNETEVETMYTANTHITRSQSLNILDNSTISSSVKRLFQSLTRLPPRAKML